MRSCAVFSRTALGLIAEKKGAVPVLSTKKSGRDTFLKKDLQNGNTFEDILEVDL